MIQARRPTLVVVGTGMAGARVVEELLARAPDRFSIRMFGDEPHGTYNRILLSGVLGGSVDPEQLWINPLEWYEARGVRVHAGVRVERIKFLLFCLTGLMSGVAAVLLTSRLGSTRPSIAQGWELEVITMVVLGGVNILGGAGSIIGVVIAAFIMGLVTFGMGLLNVPGIVQSIFIGLLLILVIALPIVVEKLRGLRK